MASQPAHAQWCTVHERYYRGEVCTLCLWDIAPHRLPGTTGRVLVSPDGGKLRAARHAKQWSSRELARQAGLGHTHVHRIEQGGQGRITLQTASRLAEALGTTVAALTRDPAED